MKKGSKPAYKRQTYWVDTPLQIQMLGFVVLLISASLLLTAFSVLRGIEYASENSMQVVHSVEWVQEALRAPLFMASAISLLAGGLLTLFWSHRFAAPLRVIAAAIVRIRHGNMTVPVHLRTTDAHQDLARQFQHMQEDLQRSFDERASHAASAAALLESAEKALPEDHPARPDISQALDHLRSIEKNPKL